MSTYLRRTKALAAAALLAVAMAFCLAVAPQAYAELTGGDAVQFGDAPAKSEATIDSVRAAIHELSVDPTSYTAADKDRIEAIAADFAALDRKSVV